MIVARIKLALPLGACFFGSGAAALCFEALWFRQAGLAFGNSVWASSLVLAAFMAGMAVGNLLAARVGDRIRNPIATYAKLELAVGVLGTALVYGLPALGSMLAPISLQLAGTPLGLSGLRLGLSFLLLLLPASAMGMTLPLLTRALSERDARFGGALGFLYGANTLGAVVGVACTELFLLGTLGIRGSAWLGAGVCGLSGVGAWWVAQGGSEHAHGHGDVGAQVEVSECVGQTVAEQLPWLVSAFLAGFALLALEVVWLRLLMLFVNDTPVAFAMVLSVVLGGIALGGLLGAPLFARAKRAVRYCGVVAYAAGASGVAGYLVYPHVLQRVIRADQDALMIAIVALPLVLPTALCSGMLFTALGAGLRSHSRAHASAAGLLTCANTLGAALGSLSAGFLLLPRLGMEASLFGLFALYGLIGLLLVADQGASAFGRFGATVVFAGALALFPFGKVDSMFVLSSARRWMDRYDEIAEVREGAQATIVHIRHQLAGLHIFDQLAQNAYSMTVNDFAARRYMKLFVYLPRAVHPGIENALIVGYGLGSTAQALTNSSELKRLDVVDISRDMLSLARGIEPPTGKHPLQDPRVRVHIEDGRYFLQATERRYDLITGEPPPPIIAGVESLYSQEYFELIHSRLARGGIASYWLPLMNITASSGKAIIAAFCQAFPDCSLWHGVAENLMLMGSRDGAGPVSQQRFVSQWQDAAMRQELIALGFELPPQLGTLFIADADALRDLTTDTLPVTDDWPQRMHAPGTREEVKQLLWSFRDTERARRRFLDSPLTKRLFPQRIREASSRAFENQRLINDLLFPGKSAARQLHILDTILARTPFRLPVLLLMKSDPDIQRSLARATPRQLATPELAIHVAAGKLADRDAIGALHALSGVPDERLPYPDLRQYLQSAVQQPAPHERP